MPDFVPRVIVKLRDDVAALIPYEDNAENALPPNFRAGWDSIVRSYPDAGLTLNRAIQGVNAEILRSKLEENATRTGTPSKNLLAYFAVPVPPGLAEVIVSALQTLPFVEYAYVEKEVTLPAVNFADDPLVVGQGYFSAAPTGVDAFHVWALPFADGSQVRFVDVEFGWQLTHEDLVDAEGVNQIPVLASGTFSANSDFINHGTAVLGIVMAQDNTKGIVGLAPGVNAAVAPVLTPAGTLALADALAVVLTNPFAGPNSIVLIEQQDALFLPVETDVLVRDAILELTRNEIVVIEAAGNGGTDLDTFSQFDPDSEAFFDSGAIMVAAATSLHPHTRVASSNHGKRIDCYAWGENILTTSSLSDPLTGQPYMVNFRNTSGASAIIAGVCVVLQNIRRSVMGDFVSPANMRGLVNNAILNTLPGDADIGRIGVMPDLKSLEPAVLTL